MECLNLFCPVKGALQMPKGGLNYHFLKYESCLSYYMSNKKGKKINIAPKMFLIYYMIQIHL